MNEMLIQVIAMGEIRERIRRAELERVGRAAHGSTRRTNRSSRIERIRASVVGLFGGRTATPAHGPCPECQPS